MIRTCRIQYQGDAQLEPPRAQADKGTIDGELEVVLRKTCIRIRLGHKTWMQLNQANLSTTCGAHLDALLGSSAMPPCRHKNESARSPHSQMVFRLPSCANVQLFYNSSSAVNVLQLVCQLLLSDVCLDMVGCEESRERAGIW